MPTYIDAGVLPDAAVLSCSTAAMAQRACPIIQDRVIKAYLPIVTGAVVVLIVVMFVVVVVFLFFFCGGVDVLVGNKCAIGFVIDKIISPQPWFCID